MSTTNISIPQDEKLLNALRQLPAVNCTVPETTTQLILERARLAQRQYHRRHVLKISFLTMTAVAACMGVMSLVMFPTSVGVEDAQSGVNISDICLQYFPEEIRALNTLDDLQSFDPKSDILSDFDSYSN